MIEHDFQGETPEQRFCTKCGSSETHPAPCEPPKILCAALRDDAGKVHTVARPGRHGNIINRLSHAGMWSRTCVLGFIVIDNRGVERFVERIEAKKIARVAEQLLPSKLPPEHQLEGLFSEDVW